MTARVAELEQRLLSLAELCDEGAREGEEAGDHYEAAWWRGRSADFARSIEEIRRDRASRRD